MSWFKRIEKGIQTRTEEKKDIPKGLWYKTPTGKIIETQELAENYYVNQAPVYNDFGYILLLNLGTIIICLLILLIPSYIITKISPIKAIRFD